MPLSLRHRITQKERTMTLQDKLDSLKPGQSIVISGNEAAYCSAEVSTDGKKMRFVRTFQNVSWEVFRTVSLK